MIGEILLALGIGATVAAIEESNKKTKQTDRSEEKRNDKSYKDLLKRYYRTYENQVFQEKYLREIQRQAKIKKELSEIKRDLKSIRREVEDNKKYNVTEKEFVKIENSNEAYIKLLKKYYRKYKDQVFKEKYLYEIKMQLPVSKELSEIKTDLKQLRKLMTEREQKTSYEQIVNDKKKKVDSEPTIVCVDKFVDEYILSLKNMDYVFDEVNQSGEFVQEFVKEKCELIHIIDMWLDKTYRSFDMIEVRGNDVIFQEIILDKAMLISISLKEKDYYKKAHIKIYSADTKKGHDYIMGRPLAYTIEYDNCKLFLKALNMYRLGQEGMLGIESLEKLMTQLMIINKQGWVKE